MPTFKYIAKNAKGETINEEAEGKNKRDIVEALRTKGFFVTTIAEKEKERKKKRVPIFSAISLKDKMMFARHLGVMLSSGLSVPKSLDVISNQTKNRRFRNILAKLSEDIKMGNGLADSLAKYPVFDELSVNMIRVGEVGGNLEEVLGLLANQLEKEHTLLTRVRGAMYYPAVILLVMVGVGIAMMTYVVPRLTEVFSDIQTELPLSTRVIMAVSNYMNENQLLIFISAVLIIILVLVFFQTRYGKKLVSIIFFRMPGIKNIMILVNNARFVRIYSSLTKSGVSVVESLRIVSRTLSNSAYQKAFQDISTQVEKGKPLHEELARYPKLFPVLTIQMVDVGEETGRTVDILLNLAKFYESEINQITKNFSSIIEPVLMVIIGVAVGFFAVSMILPMYSVMENM